MLWGFSYLGAQWRLFRLCEAVERGPLRLCETVVEDWFECCTLSPVWSSGEGKDVFTLFRLVASIVPDVRCIDVFTHNSLRDKGDSLVALSRTHQTICSRKLDVVVGWEAAENQSLFMITICEEELRWMWCYAWFGMIDFSLVNCFLNATLSIIRYILFMNLFYEYHCLWLAYPYLFVCMFVACAMIV